MIIDLLPSSPNSGAPEINFRRAEGFKIQLQLELETGLELELELETELKPVFGIQD